MKNKVLVLTSTFPRWKNDSTPSFVYWLCDRLARKGKDIVVLAPHAHGAARSEKLGKMQVHRFRYFFPERLQKIAYGAGIISNIRNSFLAKIQVPFFLLSEYFAAKAIIKKYAPDILHAHWIIPQGVLGVILKKTYRIPLVVTIHGSDLFPLRNPVFRHFQEMVLRNCDACTVNSIATKEEVTRRFSKFNEKISIVPMGVDISLFAKKNKKSGKIGYQYKKIILFVGRLNEQKGVEYLIKALSILKDKFSNIRLLVIGEGDYKLDLIKIAESLKIEGYVEFLGGMPHKKVIDYYKIADVFVLPSITSKIGTEGLGLVLLEAMAAKLPVVGTNTGGIRYTIKNKENGILVQEKNPKELADGIELLLSNSKLREKIKNNALRFVSENYSWNSVVKKFDSLYEKIK